MIDFKIVLGDDEVRRIRKRYFSKSSNYANPDRVLESAMESLGGIDIGSAPDIVQPTLARLATVAAMASDREFGLTGAKLGRALLTLQHAAAKGSELGGGVSSQVALQEALVLEVGLQDLSAEMKTYEEFVEWKRTQAALANQPTSTATGKKWLAGKRAEITSRVAPVSKRKREVAIRVGDDSFRGGLGVGELLRGWPSLDAILGGDDAGARHQSGGAKADKEQGKVVPIWYATNRKPEGDGFSTERDYEIHRGRVDVRVPKAHRFGETGSSWWTKLKRLDFRDDKLRISTISPHSRDEFYAAIRSQHSDLREHGLIFLHGYRNSFSEAVIRAAQLAADLEVQGPTAVFSWPSRGRVASYTVDEASIEASEAAITSFLIEFAERSGVGRLHIIAHSMGNRGLLRALQRIGADVRSERRPRFSQILLAAPDVDRDLFLDLAHLYPSFAERTTLYASKRDLPVLASQAFHDAPRAGYFDPVTWAKGIDTVTVPDFDVDLLGHSYFAEAEALLNDIFALIRRGDAPSARQRLRTVAGEDGPYWEFVR